MSRPNDRPAFTVRRDPTAGQPLLPVLLWLNRQQLASRFPDWQPPPPPARSPKAP